MVLNVYFIQNQVMLSNGGLSASGLLLYFRNSLPAFELNLNVFMLVKIFHMRENTFRTTTIFVVSLNTGHAKLSVCNVF